MKVSTSLSVCVFGGILSSLCHAFTTPTINTTPAGHGQGQQAADYCTPEVFQAGREVTTGIVRGGKTTVDRSAGSVTYSAKQRKIALIDGIYHPDKFTKRIFDYPTNTLYTIKGAIQQTCTKTRLPGPFTPQCVPGNSTITMANVTYGAGTNTMSAIELSGTTNSVHYRVTLSHELHVPIYEQLWGSKDGANFYSTLSFFNVTVNPWLPSSVFQPPAACDNVAVTQTEKREANVMDRSVYMAL